MPPRETPSGLSIPLFATLTARRLSVSHFHRYGGQRLFDARIAEGSDYIKIIYDDNKEFGESQRWPTLDKDTLRALIEAAHKRGKLAVAHILSEQQARGAIAAGIGGGNMCSRSDVSFD